MLGFHPFGTFPFGTIETVVEGPILLIVDRVDIGANVFSPAMVQGFVVSPDLVGATVVVSDIELLAGTVDIKPLMIALDAKMSNIKVFDPVLGPRGYFFNETAIEFFRQQTGLNAYQFNELAKAYYEQASGVDPQAFNDLLKAAQDAIGFVGLSPTDWRNS